MRIKQIFQDKQEDDFVNIECCVCDMDGTLLNSTRDVSEKNVKAIRELQEKGVVIVLATGRTDLYVKDVAHRLGILAPVISSNGGMVRQLNSTEVLCYKYLPNEIDRKLAENCFKNNDDMIVYSPDRVYYREGSERVKLYHSYNERVQPEFRVPIQEIKQAEELPFGKVLKIFLWNVAPERTTALQNIFHGQLAMVSSEKNAFDIMAKGISKGEALRFLSKKMGFDLNKTAVFGDNYNDISMLNLAGYPIAMANAEEAVKRQAKYVTASNDEDGVAYAIEHYILA